MSALIFAFFQMLSYLVFAHAILAYVMAPDHPVREAIARIVEPMLAPIRQIMPTTGSFDFSTLILFFVLRFAGTLFANLF